jgi:uncharacterized protein YciI
MEPQHVGAPSVDFDLDVFTLLVLREGGKASQLDGATVQRLQAEHLRYLFGLQAAGHLLAAGAVSEKPDGESLTGLGFFSTESLDEVRRLAEADPAVQAGLDAADVVRFVCPKGAISFRGGSR